MTSVAAAELDQHERRVIEALLTALREELGEQLRSVWLYGSRARGERSGPESDVDLLVVTDGGRARDLDRVLVLIERVAEREGASPLRFDARVVTPEWVRGRRAIDSFFMRDVDRDKIVLAGDP